MHISYAKGVIVNYTTISTTFDNKSQTYSKAMLVTVSPASIQKRLIYSKLISEALFFIFLEVKNEGYEKLSLKQSFKKVEIIFNSISDYGNFEDFYKDNFNNESKFSFNDLSKIIQKMSDYQFDKLILEMGKI
jgi:hypothetical protein